MQTVGRCVRMCACCTPRRAAHCAQCHPIQPSADSALLSARRRERQVNLSLLTEARIERYLKCVRIGSNVTSETREQRVRGARLSHRGPRRATRKYDANRIDVQCTLSLMKVRDSTNHAHASSRSAQGPALGPLLAAGASRCV